MAAKAFKKAAKKQGTGNKKRQIALALQGGSVHGAYTWGVLDELLKCDQFEITAISGASAGAMNATFLAYGLLTGGPEKAQKMLRALWEEVIEQGMYTPFHSTPLDRLLGQWPGMETNPWAKWAEWIMENYPVEVWNPTRINVIKKILEKHIDFNALQKADKPMLFVNAMNVKKNRSDVFTRSAITKDVVAASANLREIMPPVKINGEEYWDGGHMENPSITPLADHTDAPDILAIMLYPQTVDKVPSHPKEISRRVHDVQYSTSAYKDMERLAKRNELIEKGALDPKKSGMRKVRLHCIVRDGDKTPKSHNNMNLDRDWIMTLYQRGKEEARAWLAANADKIGKESSFDPMGTTSRPYGSVIGLHDDCPNDRYCPPKKCKTEGANNKKQSKDKRKSQTKELKRKSGNPPPSP